MSGIIDHLVGSISKPDWLLLVNDIVLLDYVDNPPVMANEGSWALKLRHLACRVSVIFVCQAIVTVALLVAIEILFEFSNKG